MGHVARRGPLVGRGPVWPSGGRGKGVTGWAKGEEKFGTTPREGKSFFLFSRKFGIWKFGLSMEFKKNWSNKS